MKYFFLLFLVTASFADPLAYFPNCKDIKDPDWWAQMGKIINQSIVKMNKEPDDHLLTRVINFRHTFAKRDLCLEIKELFNGETPRIKDLENGKILLLSDTHTRYQILLDTSGQYYRIYRVGDGREGKHFIDYNFNLRGKRLRWDFEELSHFDYLWTSKETFIDKNFIKELTPEVKARIQHHRCKQNFHNTFKR